MNYKFLFFLLMFSLTVKAQDTIVKLNGEVISAKISEVGTNAITYKKMSMLDGPTFVDYKTDILFVKYTNGQKQYFNKDQINSIQKSILDSAQIKKNESLKTEKMPDKGMNKIDFLEGKYSINGQKASQKDVNRLLASSKNPAITLPLKAAKTTKTFQKIIKITSIPTTIGGGGALLWTGIDMYNDIRRGRDNTSTYIGTFTSLLTTITFPITSNILKRKSEKMYGKLIDIYNVTN